LTSSATVSFSKLTVFHGFSYGEVFRNFYEHYECLVVRRCSDHLEVFKKLKLSHCTKWRRLGERRYSTYSFTTSALDEVIGQRHAPAAL
jgi:hypothetical protein